MACDSYYGDCESCTCICSDLANAEYIKAVSIEDDDGGVFIALSPASSIFHKKQQQLPL